MRTERGRRDAALARVLRRLQRGPALNKQLNKICFRYGARIFELRRRGHQIKTQSAGKGVFRYVLMVS
jgi:hypothetical protein